MIFTLAIDPDGQFSNANCVNESLTISLTVGA